MPGIYPSGTVSLIGIIHRQDGAGQACQFPDAATARGMTRSLHRYRLRAVNLSYAEYAALNSGRRMNCTVSASTVWPARYRL